MAAPNIVAVDERLRSAGDFVGSMMQYETEAIDAGRSAFRAGNRDFSDQSEAFRKFQRDFEAFITASRTAWNYMIGLSNAAGSRKWLDSRLSSKLCQFHRGLANIDLHATPIIFGVRQRVKVEADALFPGADIRQSLAAGKPLTVTEFTDIRLVYEPKNLRADVVDMCVSVQRQHPDESVVELAARYLHALRSACKAGKESGKFTPRL